MSCKSALYAANTAAQTLTSGSVINMGQIVRRFGPGVGLSGGNVTLSGSGYYDIDANFSINNATAGDITISLFNNGVAIPGATATISAAATTNYALTIPAVVREFCCNQSTITAVITGDATIINAAIVVEKI